MSRTLTFERASILMTSERFSLSKKAATSTGTWQCKAAVFSFILSSWIIRSTWSAEDSVSRIWPVPVQRGQVIWLPSDKAGRSRWRDSSNSPNLEIFPVWTRARSWRSESLIRFSTSFWLLGDSISIKSITINPPRSRRRIWRAISSAASRLVLVAVSSISEPRVARAELTSTETSASVWSITIAPPEGKDTVLE